MQRLIGYSLTGDISEQIMMFLVGGGSNGKSTFINTIKDLIGEYGKQAKSDTFIKKKIPVQIMILLGLLGHDS